MAEAKRIVMPSASFIVARSFPDGVIGCENKLPWKLKTDLRRFRELTTGHAVIMGRKTLESIGRPLPNRVNIVVSRSQNESIEGVQWVSTLEDALFMADYHSICKGKNDFFVIGGDQIYSSFLKRNFYNRIFLTEVFTGKIEGDAYFKYEFDLRQWKIVEERDFLKSENDEYGFRFVTYEKKAKYIRYRLESEFMTDYLATSRWKEGARIALARWEAAHPSNEIDEPKPDIQEAFVFAAG